MSITQTNSIAKIAAVVAGLGLVAMSFASFAVPAQAATDNSAQIAALQAQLAALMAAQGSTSTSVTFTRDLTVNSTGADVTALQNWLISKGFSIPAGATGFFGAQTRAAVAAWQASAGITPAAGFFGPKSRAAAGAVGGSTGTTGGTTTGGLSGGAGKLKNVSSLGDVNSDLKEGDSATKVLGFSADAQDSDVAVQRVDVLVTLGGNGSASANKYFNTIALYQDGKKLASLDATAGDKNGRVWTYRFADVNGVIREGNTGNFYVEVTPISSVGSAESGDTITVAFPTDGVRAVDAEGVSETYSVTGGASQTFSVSTATIGTLTINEGSDNPKSTSVKADLNNTTTGITLLSFNLKAKNQDVIVHDLPVTITSNAASTSDYVQTVKLMKGSTVLKSKTIPAAATAATTVVFDGIDQTITKDASVNYSVVVDVRKIDAGGSNSFNSGDTLTASIPNGGAWDTEDSNGDAVSNPSTFTGNPITFQATGVTVTKVDASYNKTVGTVGSGDNTQYSISFKVTAGDDDLYIARTLSKSVAPSTSATTWATTTSSTASSTGSQTASLSAADSNSSDSATVYKIPAGTTRTFTLNVTLVANQTGYVGVQLTGIAYGLTTTPNASYTSGLDTFKTADVSMTTH